MSYDIKRKKRTKGWRIDWIEHQRYTQFCDVRAVNSFFLYFGGLLMFLLFGAASLIAIFHFIYTSHHSKADSSSSSSSYSYLKFTELCALFLCENNIQHHKIRSFVIFFSLIFFFFFFIFILLCGWFRCSVQRIEYTNYGVRMTTQHKYSAFGVFFHSFCDMTRWIILYFLCFPFNLCLSCWVILWCYFSFFLWILYISRSPVYA